jgi:hypothetical protein
VSLPCAGDGDDFVVGDSDGPPEAGGEGSLLDDLDGDSDADGDDDADNGERESP